MRTLLILCLVFLGGCATTNINTRVENLEKKIESHEKVLHFHNEALINLYKVLKNKLNIKAGQTL